MRILLVVATTLQVIAAAYCVLLLRKHWVAATAWLCLLGVLLSMLVWRVVVATGITPGVLFNTVIAIWGSACAVLAMFFFSREVARRERAEAERDQLLASERSARSEAEGAIRIKDEFMATLSHELRTPLAAILGWCALFRRARSPAEAERAIATIERNAQMQSRLVDDLLDATRMQAGSLYLESSAVSLDVPVSAAVEAAKPSADAKQVSVDFACQQPAPVVIGDTSRLQQIAANLIDNAIKFTPSGKSVQVALRSHGRHAELSVVDEGIGIEDAFLPQLFQRFRQAETGNARRHGGLGLGLSIVSSLVQLHHGTVNASSGGGGAGATFVVRLPLAPAGVPAASGAVVLRHAPETRQSIDAVRLLFVDDEADVREAVASLLDRSGAEVLALESGTSIEAEIARFRPDALVIDIGMPGEDGYSLIRRIRRLAKPACDIPAISLTAHARDEDRRTAIDAGFQAHLPKPVHLPLLLSTIRELTGRSV